MRHLFFGLLALSGCTGLHLDNGNAYPCDFSQGPGVRDAVCLGGDVCGTNNLCQKYIYEGPRFEGQPTFAVYGPGSGEGQVLHPMVLKDPVTFVTQELPIEARTSAFAGTAAGIFELKPQGKIADDLVVLPAAPPAVGDKTLVSAQPFASASLLGFDHSVLLAWKSGELSVGTVDRTPGNSTLVRRTVITEPFNPVGARVVPSPPPANLSRPVTGTAVVWTATDVGFLEGANWRYVPVAFDGGAVVDVAGLAQPGQLWLLAMTRDALFLGDVDAGTTRLAETFLPLSPAPLPEDSLRTDRGVRMVAAVRRGIVGPGQVGDVLSTFQVSLGAAGPELTRTWPDCRPCTQATQRLEVFAPSIASGFPVVEVACVGLTSSSTEMLRVIGSAALTQSEGCVTESLEVPILQGRVMRTLDQRLVQWNSQSGLILGGKSGEVWTGETLSGLLPLYLDRVPRDVTTISLPSGERLLAAITDNAFTLQQTPTSTGMKEVANGFRRIGSAEFGIAQVPRLLSFLRGGNGWAVSARGEVDQATMTDAGLQVTLGPTLVTASGDPIRDSMGGEAFTTADGGVSLFVAADDSLYFIDESLLGKDREELLTPDLTPEPSVPIRSLALERTLLGTNGIDKARGYLVTSRNVYSWQLGGNPTTWSSTPLVLAGGQPVEVWFDQPRSALGRVGYSDGQIYTLPGGHELAEPLPENADGVAPQVYDYENLGGWPVAYANTGVFIAGWEHDGGKLQNRFPDGGINRPMSWSKITLPDGGHPWTRGRETRPGRLFVKLDPPIPDPDSMDGGVLKPQHLVLFLDDQVFQLATHNRK